MARNAMPVTGIVFLGWDARQPLTLYFLDTMASLAAIWVVYRLHYRPAGSWPTGSRPPSDLLIGNEIFAMIVLLWLAGWILGAPVYLLARRGPDFADNPMFLASAAFQLAAAVHMAVMTHREMSRVVKQERLDAALGQRAALVLGRWLIACVAGVFFLDAAAMVLAYLAASAYIELRPPKPPERTVLPPD